MRMLTSLRNRFQNKALFEQRLAEVKRTPPIAMKSSRLLFVSLVNERDLLMYLLAIKSVYRCLGEGQVCAICDDVSVEGRRLLRQHVEEIELVDVQEIDTGRCPAGGTWERLVFIIDRSQHSYVIQVDSDVLAFPPLTEVRLAYRVEPLVHHGPDWRCSRDHGSNSA